MSGGYRGLTCADGADDYRSSWTSVDVAARFAGFVCAFGRPASCSNAVAMAASRSRVACW